MSDIPGYSNGEFGPDNKRITFTLENDTDLDRTEVVGVMALFPDGADGILPESINDYYLYLEGGRETIGFGVGNSYTTNYTYNATLPWCAPLNAITAGSGAIKAGSCVLTYTYFGYGPTSWPTGSLRTDKVTVTDNGLGQFIHPGIVSSSINYTTGAISIQFLSNYGPAGDQPVRITYKFNAPTKYPTQWTILRKWPTGRVRQAKAWIGQASGVGVFIPKKIQTITTSPVSTQTKEYTRGYLRIGYDPSVNLNLPAYTVHASLATAIAAQMSSYITDVNSNQYFASLVNNSFEENILENPANNGGKGWMRVVQRRSYHSGGDSYNTFSGLKRDFLSVTSYHYIPHNSRSMEFEIRLGNDYQGADPLEHVMTESLGTGNGSQTLFSASMTHTFPSVDGQYGHLRKGKVRIYQGSTLVAWDSRGTGTLEPQGGAGITGGVDYSTGSVTVTFTTAPQVGQAITCTYNTYYLRIGLASGVQTLNYTLPSKASQYGIHVRVGGGSTAAYEGWDGGSTIYASTSQIVPYVFNTINPAQVKAGPLLITETGTIGTNLVPGTVEFFAHTSDAGATSVIFCRDNGQGALSGRGVTSGTIDYVTGAFSITFSVLPGSTLNLYAGYGQTGSARYISGSITYSTRALAVTTSQSVAANTPVFVSYIRNTLATSYTHDPNMHPMGSVGFKRWGLLIAGGANFTDIMCEASQAYPVTIGGGSPTWFPTIIDSGVISGGGADPWMHEHLHDGASVSRVFFAYAGTGATTAEANTWAAQKIHKIQTLPTLEAYNESRAYGLLEGGMKIVTPEQEFDWTEMTKRSFSEDIARRASQLTVAYPNPWVDLGGGNGYFQGYIRNKANDFSAVDAWNLGNPKGSGVGVPGIASGVRNSLNWQENLYTAVNQGGAPRALHDSSIYFLYGQSWQGVRYMYHAALFNYVRPGAVLWNFAGRSKWNDRGYHVYIGTQADAGMLVSSTPIQTTYEHNTQEYLGRGWRFGWSQGTVSVVKDSNRVEFSYAAGQPSNTAFTDNFSVLEVNYNNGGSFRTMVGTTQADGKRRIIFSNCTEVYTITSVSYDTNVNKWIAILDRGVKAATSTSSQFAIVTDPRKGIDIVAPRNDPRNFIASRVACGAFRLQHGIEADSSSHQAFNSCFDVWGTTGSWMLWDFVRHAAEWNMVSMKEYVAGVFRQDQMRTSAWTQRAILVGYTITKDLVGVSGFSFLTDPTYGDAKTRLGEWLRIRWTQWCNFGAKGEMDPNNTIATNGKKKFADIRVTSSSDKGDWYSMADVGSPNPAYGGAGSFNSSLNRWVGPTEGQVRFDDLGFTYVSVWEIGYLTPWMAAAYREFRFDTTPVDMPQRGEYSVPFNQVMERIFNGYATLIVDYAWITQQMNFPVRGYPGMFQASTYGNPTFPELTNQWGEIIPSGPGTPVNLVTNPATDPNRLRKYLGTINWPTSDINYFATQIYWLRGASRTLGSTQYEDIDRLGWPLPNRGGFTSFELVDPSWKTGWHSPGIAFSGNPIIPAQDTNPQVIGTTHPRIRPNQHPEGFNLEGSASLTFRGVALTWSTCPFLMMVARFHSDPARRAQAGDILNRVIWQAMAMSLIKGVYDSASEYREGAPIEYNYFAGPITGDFPYSADLTSQPVNRWWDNAYRNRRQIVSNNNHGDQIADTDVFELNLSLYDIPSDLVQSNGADIRVVRQLSDGTNQVCKSIARKDASGNWRLFVTVPTVIASASAILASSPSEAWYVYYGSGVATPASWTNTNNIDAPFAVDPTTIFLWNQDGNYTVDAGPYNVPLESLPGQEPDYGNGRFGGAIRFVGANLDAAGSQTASVIMRPGGFFLGSAGSFEFQFYIDANVYEVSSGATQGLFSIIDDDNFPVMAYVDSSDRKLNFVVSLGAAAPHAVYSLTAVGPTRQVAFTSDGTGTEFDGTLVPNIIPGSFSIISSNGAISAEDNGLTVLTGMGITSGRINYETGVLNLTLSSPIPNGATIIAYYNTTNNSWSPNRWNHCRLTYDGTRLLLSVNGHQAGLIVASGPFRTLDAASPTGLALGAILTPATLFSNHMTGRISEVRISTADRGAPFVNDSPLQTSLLAEESILTTSSSQNSAAATIAGLVTTLPAAVAMYVAALDITSTNSATGDILLYQNVEVTESCDMYIAVDVSYGADTANLALVLNDRQSTVGTVGFSVASLNEVTRSADAAIATQANLVNQIDAAIQLTFTHVSPVALIVAVTSSAVLACDCTIATSGGDITVTNPAGGSIIHQKSQSSQSDLYIAQPVTSLQGLVSGSIAVERVADNAGQPFTGSLAIVRSNVEFIQDVEGHVATNMMNSPTQVPVALLVGSLESVTAPVALHVFGATVELGSVMPVAGSIQVGDIQTLMDANLMIAMPRLEQSHSIAAAIQQQYQVTTQVVGNIFAQNVVTFVFADGFLSTSPAPIQIICDSILALAESTSQIAGLSVQTTGQVLLPVSLRITGDAGTYEIPASAAIMLPKTETISVVGDIASSNEVFLPASVSFANLRDTQLEVSMSVTADTYAYSIDCAMIVANSQSTLQTGGGDVATTHSEYAVCRGNIVVELTNQLNATGIDTTQPR